MNSAEALMILNMVDHIGPITVRRLLEKFGNPETILDANESNLKQVEGVGPKSARAISKWRDEIPWEAELEKIQKSGIHLITSEDDEYPIHLKEIHDPPLVLYIKGKLRDRQKNSIAIVGMRHPTHYGEETARTLSYQLGSVGMSVVSGLAAGIDSWAHKGCLQAKGHTVAVLGFGFGYLSKSGNAKLAEEMIEKEGAIITEFPFTRQPDRQTFPMRNRIVSGMAMGTLVVEAGVQSGALITAHFATEQGRQVFAVPGRIDNPQAQGCHKLIQNGAKLTQSIEDILEEFEYLIPKNKIEESQSEDQKPAISVNLTETEKLIFNQLSTEEREIDEITSACELPTSIVSSTLLVLEMKKVARQLPGKRYVRAR
jgi:DNA processing protein